MLKTVYGLEKIKNILVDIKNSARISNLAFIGNKGYGKSLVASSYAKLLHCEKNIQCDRCRSCIMHNNGYHPDFIKIESLKNKITIDIIREFFNKIDNTVQISNLKVIYFKEADDLTIEAANAILKTLEESPRNILIIFGIKSERNILFTIKSRLIKIYFPPPAISTIKKVLKNKYRWKDDDVNKYYHLFTAGIRKDWLENWSNVSIINNELNYFLNQINSLDEFKIIDRIDQWTSIIHNELILEFIFIWARQLILNRLSIEKFENSNSENISLFNENHSNSIKFNYLLMLKIIDILNEAQRSIESQSNKQLTIEICFLRIRRIMGQLNQTKIA